MINDRIAIEPAIPRSYKTLYGRGCERTGDMVAPVTEPAE